MSKNEKENLTENKQASNDEQNGKLEVDTAVEGKAIQVSHASEVRHGNLQKQLNEGTHVNPSDVIIIEQLSHELLEQNSSENSECNVIYEFTSEDETNNPNVNGETDYKVTFEFMIHCDKEKINQLSKTSAISCLKFAQVSDIAESCSILHVADKFIATYNTKCLDKDAPEASRNSDETDRKRKKSLTSLMQNKKQKEIGSSNNQVRKTGSSDNSSDEFADIEDNIKDSVSSDNSDSNVTTETKIQSPLKIFDLNVEPKEKDEFLYENKCSMVNFGESSSCSTNSKYVDKTEEKMLFSTSLKGETTPIVKFPEDMKKKFELSMPTILEARESESDEQISQAMQPKTNPLKMKVSVVKRKDKCHVCNARLGLCAIKCRCGGYYCAKHRYDKEHNCTFDYKSMGAEEIEKNNPRIVAEKVRKL